jgi:hypothetical protein
MIYFSEDICEKIASILLAKGSLTSEQLKLAKKSASEQQCCLAEILIENKYITQEELADEIAKLYGLKRISLQKAGDVEDKAYSLLSEDFIVENHVVPFSLSKDVIKVAISDPLALSVMGHVKIISG